MEPIGIIVILLISIFGLTAYVLYLRQKESKTMQDSNALKIKESELYTATKCQDRILRVHLPTAC